jgi:nucleoside-diphosphate-sugar epimerase
MPVPAPRYNEVLSSLQNEPKRWLVTGVAGFIGSSIIEKLLSVGQEVIGVDNFETGHKSNLDDVRAIVGEDNYKRFQFVNGNITRVSEWEGQVDRFDYVLHQAALGSVPRSIDDPVASNSANVDGFVQVMNLAHRKGARKCVYASSSSVYGDDESGEKREEKTGNLLSPYAVTKAVNELYAAVFARTHGMNIVGLRYFNVFGPRQDPNGAYAAVIPKWLGELFEGKKCTVNGDGTISRDFCSVHNVVQANILAATTPTGLPTSEGGSHEVCNVACGASTSLKTLFYALRDKVALYRDDVKDMDPHFGPFRKGDIVHSLANVTKATEMLGYVPQFSLEEGMGSTVEWYAKNLSQYSKKG